MPKPKIVRCPTCGRKSRRSSEANRRYWALLHEISENIKPQGKQYGSETWHEYLKSRFLGADERELPNGKTMMVTHSTAELDTPGFADYQTQVEIWANEHGAHLSE